MNDKQTTRRKFLVAALTFSGVASSSLGMTFLRSSATWAADADASENLVAMGRLAQLLFPHAGLATEVYAEVVGEVLAITAADPATDGILSVAEDALNTSLGKAWATATEAEQLSALTALQNEAFIVGIRETVRFRLYDNAGLWQHINYPGSSKEHGGYINRGFDDIDWLPEQG
jgi:hypothetical protein